MANLNGFASMCRDCILIDYSMRVDSLAPSADVCRYVQVLIGEMKASGLPLSNGVSNMSARTASELNLNATDFAACVAAMRHDAEILADKADAVELGIRGTPTFVIARTSGDAPDGAIFIGNQPYAVFAAKLAQLGPKLQ